MYYFRSATLFYLLAGSKRTSIVARCSFSNWMRESMEGTKQDH